MKRIVRLTESDLTRIVRRVINEEKGLKVGDPLYVGQFYQGKLNILKDTNKSGSGDTPVARVAPGDYKITNPFKDGQKPVMQTGTSTVDLGGLKVGLEYFWVLDGGSPGVDNNSFYEWRGQFYVRVTNSGEFNIVRKGGKDNTEEFEGPYTGDLTFKGYLGGTSQPG